MLKAILKSLKIAAKMLYKYGKWLYTFIDIIYGVKYRANNFKNIYIGIVTKLYRNNLAILDDLTEEKDCGYWLIIQEWLEIILILCKKTININIKE